MLIDRRQSITTELERLEQLAKGEQEADNKVVRQHLKDLRLFLPGIGDRLGRAGFFSKSERRSAFALFCALLASTTACGIALGCLQDSVWSQVGLIFLGAYVGVMIYLLILRYRSAELDRNILYGAPLLVESLILLVESGLGILPALHEIVRARNGKRRDPILRIISEVYELSASGMSFGSALKEVSDALPHKVLRHVLMHLDISGNEGGELIPSLRSLGDHAHNEWRTSVESRVKRLENLVVFPVFVSIMGLLCLVAAAPLAPLLDVMTSLESQKVQAGSLEQEL
ncbi:MAG: type II secretion system F family protein [Bdellovibrionales bacterium]|nr:type II secretion system F family protein [Bdellovibrionales bacterium]